MERAHCYQAIARTLADQRVDVVFGVLGDANLFAMEEFDRSYGRYVACAHESATVLAAAGYSGTTGRPGVASITHGPALTNAMTALVDAVKAHMPVVLLVGDTDPRMSWHPQNIDQRAIVHGTGAAFMASRSADAVSQDIVRALRYARSASTPVVLDIGAELMWQEVAYAPSRPPADPLPVRAPDADLEDAAAVIASAHRPLVLGGRGAAGARDELVRLAGRIGAPLATSLRGKGLFAGHPDDLGVCGTLADERALAVIGEADCVIAFGAGLNALTTAEGSAVAGKTVVHVDHRAAALDGWTRADVAIAADAATTATGLIALLDAAEVAPTGFAARERAARPATGTPAAPAPAPPADAPLDLRAVLHRLDAGFTADRTLVIDDGRFVFTAYTALGAPHPAAYVHTCSFASIGLAMGHAIGAQIGAPERPALMVAGDGGFMSAGLTEFHTAVRHGVDVVVVVLNDGAYGAEYVQFEQRGIDPAICTFDWPDLAAVATSLGGTGLTVRTMSDLGKALETIAHRDRPVLVDVLLDPAAVPGGFG